MFEELAFAGNEVAYYDPQNSYLNRVIDRRIGNPIALSLLYIFLGRRLWLPVSGIGLPGHFICRYQTVAEEFYLDPFNRGKTMSGADCLQYLAHLSECLREEALTPATPRRILTRICLLLAVALVIVVVALRLPVGARPHLELAPASPHASRANSTTAHCMPRHTPRNGTLFSRQ